MPSELSQPIIRPWYREPWVWFLLGIVSLGVVSGTSVLLIGIANAPHIVTGDYQPLGKALIDTHEHTKRARELGLGGMLELDQQSAVLLLNAHRPEALPDQLLLRFQHPTDANRDLSVVVRRIDETRWKAQFGEIMPAARSRVILSDLEQSWWLDGRFSDEAAGQIRLGADRP